MCRLAAYSGNSIALGKFLMEPEHSLYRQSWAPAEMDEAVLNADGFGFGWYIDGKTPGVYTNTSPVWSDKNLGGLAVSLTSRIWLANVRSATPGQSVSHDNTQPFRHGRFLFMHNGFIDEFATASRSYFHKALPAEVLAGINGNTDSEYLFALFRHCLVTSEEDLMEAVVKTVASLPVLLGSRKYLLNLIISDGERIVAVRHAAEGHKCPSLYWAHNPADFPAGSVVASERFSLTQSWQKVDEHSILLLSPGLSPQTIALHRQGANGI